MHREALVTGAAGYIGSVLCKMLKEQGYYVIGVDLEHATEAGSKYIDVFIRNQFTAPEVLNRIGSKTSVFHLAAESLLGPSATRPIDYYLNNTSRSLKLIHRMAGVYCHKLIFASTAAVYSEQQKQTTGLFWPGQLTRMYKPVPETGILNPPNNYGMSKLMTEQMLDSIAPINYLDATSFRFFNVVGAYKDVGPSTKTPHIISSLIRHHNRGTTFSINGNDFKTRDGTCVRDYVNVKDVCRAMIHIDMMPAKIGLHRKYNLGTGKGYTNLEVYRAFNDVVNPWFDKRSTPDFGPRRIGDPAYLVADPEKFIKETGFKYNYSDCLELMINDAWRYTKNV